MKDDQTKIIIALIIAAAVVSTVGIIAATCYRMEALQPHVMK